MRLAEEWTKQLATSDNPSKSEAAQKALTTLCHTVLNSAMFLYID
jgi:hypothetical protein